MYIKITSRCDMTCAHCCMSATRKGEDMSWETFKTVIEHAEYNYVVLGGGEPLLHPEFEKFLLYALAKTDGVFIITNGSQTDRAIAIAHLAKRGVIGAALSLDPWHDPIDPEVEHAFTRDKQEKSTIFGRSGDPDQREIRDVSRGRIMRVGRAARGSFQDDWTTYEDCACCGDPVVDPNGNVRQCGCPDSPVVGNVFDGFQSLAEEDADDEWCCHKEIRL